MLFNFIFLNLIFCKFKFFSLILKGDLKEVFSLKNWIILWAPFSLFFAPAHDVYKIWIAGNNFCNPKAILPIIAGIASLFAWVLYKIIVIIAKVLNIIDSKICLGNNLITLLWAFLNLYAW